MPLMLTKPWLSALVPLLAAVVAGAAHARTDNLPPGFNPKRHMTVDEVRPGMVGFGRTVFQGTEIESFKVEVVSVEQGFQAGKAVVWVRCPDPRMQKLGPVSGMSGSPIYLYPRGTAPDRADPAEARMIGAFAFGFGLGKDCYVGVQPIEQMLAAAARSDFDRDAEDAEGSASTAEDAAGPQPDPSDRSARPADGRGNHRALSAVLHAAEALKLDESRTWRMKAMAKLVGARAAEPFKPARHTLEGRRHSNELRTPLRVGSEAMADLMAPMFAGTRIQPMAGGAGQGLAGMPPDWINPHAVKLEPGSVLTVPLVAGDLDWSSFGTVTDVLDDGTVLGFGHAMDGVGEINMPMGTGYVHFIQPSIQSSFKLAGSLRIVGALGNDETVGVFGSPDLKHEFLPATVRVEWPDESKNTRFNYKLASDRYYAPLTAGLTVAESITSDTMLDDRSTLKLKSTIRFEGGRELTIETILPQSGANGAAFEMVPPIATLRDSQFGEMRLKSVDTTVRVVDDVEAANVINATIRQTTLAPGEEVTVFAQLQPFQGKPFTRALTIEVPEDLPDGQYTVLVAGPQQYYNAQMEQRPHMTRITDMDELFEMVRYMTSLRDDALYVSLINTQRPQVAVGRAELGDLPSSKVAMLLQETSTRATPYIEAISKIEPMDYVVQGGFSFPISVKSKPEAGQ